MEKEKVRHDEKTYSENTLDFSEQFNQLELLEVHGHLIPTGTQSLWVGNSEKEEQGGKKTNVINCKKKKWKKIQANCFFGLLEKKRRLAIVQRLLSERAAEVSTRDEYTCLHQAAYSGHSDAVRRLVAQGADAHAVTVDSWTPLHSACEWNTSRVASFLFQHYTDINAQTKDLLTPPCLAAGNRESRDTRALPLMSRYIGAGLKNKQIARNRFRHRQEDKSPLPSL